MKPSIALAAKRHLLPPVLMRYHSGNLRVFGVTLHGTDRDGSDLDLLVDTAPGVSLFELGALQHEIERLLGISVNLTTPSDLPSPIRDRVMAEAQPV